MTSLGELIEHLEALPQDAVIERGFDGASPHSYRGYYERLAFEPLSNTTVKDMLAGARAAVGQSFDGYKGGTYLMEENTIVHIAMHGDCDDDEDEDLLKRLVPKAKQVPVAPNVVDPLTRVEAALRVLTKRRQELTDRIHAIEAERSALDFAIEQVRLALGGDAP